MMRTLGTLLATPLVLMVLTSPAPGQTAHLFSGGGQQSFASVQAAVDAAPDGSVILISSGAAAPLSGFTVDGKGLGIFEVPDVGAYLSMQNNLLIRNQTPGQRVVLSGLQSQESSLYLWDTMSPITVQDSSFRFSQGETLTFNCEGAKGPPALYSVRSERVALVGCEFEGGPGESTFEFSGCPGGEGGDGLRCVDSVVAVYDCDLLGGTGGNAKADPGDGGPGINATNTAGQSSTVFASNCATKGGPGGQNALFPMSQGCGGAGAEVWHNDALIYLDTVFTSGDSNNCSEPALSIQGGSVTGLPGPHRGLLAPVFAPAGSLMTVSFNGQPGDMVWMFLSTGFAFRFFSFGVLHLPVGLPLPAMSGVVPANGQLRLQIDLSAVPPSADPQVVTLQGFALGATGFRRLTWPRQILLIDASSGPDCNGNGNNDYLDIIGGSSADTNFNLIPDECPGG